MFLATLNLWLHVLAAIAWIGGMVFLAAIVAPATRGIARAERAALFDAIGRRFSRLGWVSIVVLLATGVGNLLIRVPIEHLIPYLLASRLGTLLGLKLLAIAGMLVLSAMHDFVLGPRQVALAARLQAGAAGPEARYLRTQRLSRLVAQLNLLLGLVVLFLGVSLRFAW